MLLGSDVRLGQGVRPRTKSIARTQCEGSVQALIPRVQLNGAQWVKTSPVRDVPGQSHRRCDSRGSIASGSSGENQEAPSALDKIEKAVLLSGLNSARVRACWLAVALESALARRSASRSALGSASTRRPPAPSARLQKLACRPCYRRSEIDRSAAGNPSGNSISLLSLPAIHGMNDRPRSAGEISS
jgi:hypothetical protein